MDGLVVGITDYAQAILYVYKRIHVRNILNRLQRHLHMITKRQPYFLGTIAKFTAEATCVDASRDGVNVAAGSADMTVQLINTETFQTKLFKGHEAPILNVALDPKMEYILSSSCDGTAKLWKIETSSCIKVSSFYCVD